jgi:DNA-binding transcriptional regulator YbjK
MSPVRAPRQARSQRRRDAILQAAVELVADSGVQSVSHRAVAARAGLPSSTVGYFFKSIDDLVIEALRIYISQGVGEFLDLAPVVARTGKLSVDGMIEAVALHRADPTLAMAQVTMYLEASRNVHLREPVADAVEAFRQVAERLLRLGGLPAASAASTAFHALLDGFMLHHLAKPDEPPATETMIDAMQALLVGFLLDDNERQRVKDRLKPVGLAVAPRT